MIQKHLKVVVNKLKAKKKVHCYVLENSSPERFFLLETYTAKIE